MKAEIAVTCIDIESAAQIEGAQWEAFQLQFLNNGGRFGIDVKSRQIAWSFTAALDALVDGKLVEGTPHTFISINQNEAAEKMRYARILWDNWRDVPGYPKRPSLVKSNTFEMEFANGSRLESFPCRPPRGKARQRLYLDEMAHYRESLARPIYVASLPATTKGDGYIRIGSSPLGAMGMFWEIFTENIRSYPGYVRRRIPWWHIKAFCRDITEAWILAPEMTTEERVYAYGMEALVAIFNNMFLEDFQQEYETLWVDESTAWITWDLIKANQEAFGDGAWFHADGKDDALDLLPKIKRAIRERKIERALCGGIDIGRVRDATELILCGKTTTGQMPVRVNVTLRNTEFDDQEFVFAQYFKELPITSVLIDENGIGAQLAENLGKLTKQKARGVHFTNVSKELWAVEARVQFSRFNVPMPPDRDLPIQVHSIKKLITAAGNNVYDAERNEQGHADKAWALFLAIWAAKTRAFGGGAVV